MYLWNLPPEWCGLLRWTPWEMAYAGSEFVAGPDFLLLRGRITLRYTSLQV